MSAHVKEPSAGGEKETEMEELYSYHSLYNFTIQEKKNSLYIFIW